ncbi:LOW QUALITY PROTEIN: hypothetical protein DAPPUDRAFT_249370 [Daphnia pulex]|uniref:Uncharacterized protein n=1 Tax=Daphnia pulex TaxID=6669 RepID=E9GWJ0_DAPPU|nr:LOW QUALITY PROTEIN: hypothetical protein DAPPUDRAFT_249370 [Daphnia pulex]|eukprot:EFX76178.1 LOW QUALITY PROTEIN: hypothetical protein DAPPUDRAFT_249370 [Daphnia pulex]
MSSDNSSDSSSSSSSSSPLVANLVLFNLSKAKSTGLFQWIVTGINEDKIKKCREIYKPTLKSGGVSAIASILTNPTLDESIYLRLKASKGSNATKANIDPTKKAFKKQSFKVLDLVKPLLFLSNRSKLKRKSESDVAIKLLSDSGLHSSVTSRNHDAITFFHKFIPRLLERDDMWSGVEDLFGQKFLRHLVEEAKSQATLEVISKKNKKSSSTKDQPAGPSGQFNKSNNHSNPGSRDGYVSISPYSFGGRISRFVDVWRTITGDPWILETVQHGLSLDFISPATQRRIPRNAVMNSEQIATAHQTSFEINIDNTTAVAITQSTFDGRLEDLDLSVRKDSTTMERESRSVRQLMEYTTPDFCQLVSPAQRVDDRRVHTELEVHPEFRFPPFQPHHAVSFEADPRPSNNGNGHTALAHAVMVPDPVETVDRHTPLVPSGTGFVDILAGGIPSTNGQSFHPVNHLEAFGSCLDSQGFPPEVVQLLLPQRDKTPTLHTSWRGMVGVIGAKQRQPIPCLVV